MNARRAPLFAALVLLLLVFAAPARADVGRSGTPEGVRDPAAAEALFDQARELMKDNDFAKACPKLEASQRLDPGVGTLLNLGDCYEKLGRFASAWMRFREAASAALSAGQAEREQIARRRATALETRLARLVVDTSQAGDLAILLRDGIPVDRAAWGTPVPVDPGEHTLEASAPGKKAWRGTVMVPPEAGVVTATVPALDDETESPPPALVSSPAPPAVAREERHGLGVQRGAAIGAVGVGAIALVLAGGFALSARSVYGDARAHCTSAGCDSDGIRLGHDAGTSADVATVSIVVGGVALAAAAVLWLTAK